MLCETQKEKIIAGEPLIINFPYFQNNAEFPINGYEALIQLRKDKPDGPTIHSWVDGDAAITRIDATGKISLTLSATFTNTLNFKVAYMDCWINKPSIEDGIRSGVIEFTLDRGVSR